MPQWGSSKVKNTVVDFLTEEVVDHLVCECVFGPKPDKVPKTFSPEGSWKTRSPHTRVYAKTFRLVTFEPPKKHLASCKSMATPRTSLLKKGPVSTSGRQTSTRQCSKKSTGGHGSRRENCHESIPLRERDMSLESKQMAALVEAVKRANIASALEDEPETGCIPCGIM